MVALPSVSSASSNDVRDWEGQVRSSTAMRAGLGDMGNAFSGWKAVTWDFWRIQRNNCISPPQKKGKTKRNAHVYSYVTFLWIGLTKRNAWCVFINRLRKKWFFYLQDIIYLHCGGVVTWAPEKWTASFLNKTQLQKFQTLNESSYISRRTLSRSSDDWTFDVPVNPVSRATTTL